jgi:glycosyltransferase involved in cell wall biosynthesis
LFPGGLQWHQGLDIAIRAFKQVSPSVPNAEFHIYGDGNMRETLQRLTKSLGMEAKIIFFDPLPVSRIAGIMANADLGVVPKRADSFGNEAYSTKIMEFMSVGVPVVVSNTSIDRYYFDESVVRFFESGNHEALARTMLELINDPAQLKKLSENGLKYADQHKWELRKLDYLHLVDSLLAGQSASPDLDQTSDTTQAETLVEDFTVAEENRVSA